MLVTHIIMTAFILFTQKNLNTPPPPPPHTHTLRSETASLLQVAKPSRGEASTAPTQPSQEVNGPG